MLDSDQITLLQLGLKYTPPTLVLEYRKNDNMKVRHFSVTFKKPDIKEVEIKKLRKKLMKSYPVYFNRKLILKEQLERVLNVLKRNCQDIPNEPEVGLPSSTVLSNESDKAKELHLSPSIPAIDTDPNTNDLQLNKEENYDFNIVKENDYLNSKNNFEKDRFEDEVKCDNLNLRNASTPKMEILKEPILNNDLNKLDDETLDKAKAHMSVVFDNNRILPGQEGYIYDIRKEFVPTEENDWDEDEDEIVNQSNEMITSMENNEEENPAENNNPSGERTNTDEDLLTSSLSNGKTYNVYDYDTDDVDNDIDDDIDVSFFKPSTEKVTTTTEEEDDDLYAF